MKIFFTSKDLTLLLLTLIYIYKSNAQNKNCKSDISSSYGTKAFIDRVFEKYSKNTTKDFITNEQFNNLMKSLYLGTVFFECAVGDTECKKNAILSHNFGKKMSKGDTLYSAADDKVDLFSDSRTKRSLLKRVVRSAGDDHDDDDDGGDGNAEHEKELEEHKMHWKRHLERCIKPDKLLKSHNISNPDRITRDDFIRLCPSMVEQIDAKVCVHTHIKEIEHLHGSHSEPTKAQVWGYGMLSITVISLLSLSVISMIPCLKKSYYHKIMAYLVALAVGTLSGDAMLHLIPHAFAEGVNAATNVKVSAEDQIKQHYSQVWRALFVLLGIYIFFLVEQLMKIKAMYCGGETGHGHSHGGGKSKGHSHGGGSDAEKTESFPKKKSPSDGSMVAFMKADDEKSPNTTTDEQVQVELQPTTSCESTVNEITDSGHYHPDDRHHHHHHGEKEITKDTKISSVAWMVIVGDGFHNFSDGLAVGAAFSASLSSGLSTAIAVFCHELPHELGDFAILINSGMTFKQAITYNLVSAILAYLGLAVGIGIGESETGRHFILSITAGLFLYVSLADMLPELTHQEVPHQSQCSSFICQHLGILSGIGIMLVISLYEHIM